MKFQEILELIDKVAERGIHSVEIEQSGTKVKIEGKSSQPQVFHSYHGDGKENQGLPSIPNALPPASAPSTAPPPVEDQTGLHIITSPIVGTFYRAGSPEAPSFVNVGDRITKGQVLCIVEAMKLMNEIESDIDGVITQVYPSNGQPVEYGEKLFAVKV
ncbi:MAG: acetyl-CoA carboxylase biotin carboxyl carrier protein [Acidobacteriota bacterium]